MQHLPIDPARGYVVPWFVDWIDGKPEFRAMDRSKYVAAIRHKLCWVCGQKLSTRYAFVVGPMCCINLTSAEPPSHVECGRWSCRNCPFLANPDMVRREDELINNGTLRESAPGTCIVRNPRVMAVWITREYELFDDGRGNPLVMMGRPHEVEWYTEGRSASRAEVLQSIEDGIVALELAAKTEEGGMHELRKRRNALTRWLPNR
jgi:hypothetical protein